MLNMLSVRTNTRSNSNNCNNSTDSDKTELDFLKPSSVKLELDVCDSDVSRDPTELLTSSFYLMRRGDHEELHSGAFDLHTRANQSDFLISKTL